MNSLRHTFSVWHPRQKGLPVYEEKEFIFRCPVSRTWARHQVEDVEGYVIQKTKKKVAKTPLSLRMENLVEKISLLNENAGEIGDGMLRNIVGEAKSIIKELNQRRGK